MIENEDLRDRIGLATEKDGTSIDYMPYLAHQQLEKNINKVESKEEL